MRRGAAFVGASSCSAAPRVRGLSVSVARSVAKAQVRTQTSGFSPRVAAVAPVGGHFDARRRSFGSAPQGEGREFHASPAELLERETVLRKLAATSDVDTKEVELLSDSAEFGDKSALASRLEDIVPSIMDANQVQELTELAAAVHPGYKWFSLGVWPQLVHEGLVAAHAFTGMPYVPVIIASTIMLRAAVFPFVIKTQQNSARLQIAQPKLNAVMERITAAKARGDKLGAAAAQEEAAKVMAASGANPLKGLKYVLPQAFVFIPAFFGLRRLADVDPDLAAESFFWVPSLAHSDPYFILPISFGALMLITFELGADSGKKGGQMGKVRYFMWALSAGVPLLTASLPAIIHIFWITGTVIATTQSMVLRKVPGVKQFFNIPEIPTNVERAMKSTGGAASSVTNPLNSILEKLPGGSAAKEAAKPVDPSKIVAPTHITPKIEKIAKLSSKMKNSGNE